MGVIATAAFLMIPGLECKAEITGDDAFSNLTWEQVYEENLIGSEGVVQSICDTEDYIIMIENTTDAQDVPDTVSAYYKNDVDKDGNPVQKYSLANRVVDTNWEHGNGMAYNPKTQEIYVALYTNMKPENRGSLYVMDPDTLQYKRTIKISDDYNILAIDYIGSTDQYVIQTDVAGGYSYKILNSEFQSVDDLGEYRQTAKGDNFQDLVVSGDYIITFPLTLNLGIGDYMHVYSISRRAMVADPQLNFGFVDIVQDEPESICEIEPGVFLAAVNVVNTAGEGKIRFYKTEIPYYMNISVSAENGTISESGKVLRGEDFTVSYQGNEGYELASLLVNGQEVDVKNFKDGYTLENIRQDYQIQASFSNDPAVLADDGQAGNIEKKGFSWMVSVPVLIICLGCGFFSYLLYIRKERTRKLVHARELRRQIMVDMN